MVGNLIQETGVAAAWAYTSHYSSYHHLVVVVLDFII
jgi:hypothetical protein